MKAILQSGEFEGQYLDVNGHRGTVKLSLTVDEKMFKGQCQLVLRDMDEPEIYGGDVEAELEGGSFKELNSDSFKLHLKLGVENQSLHDEKTEQSFNPEELSLSLESNVFVSDAGSFARQAIYGVISASPESGLGGGVWIAWSFKK